MYNYKFEYNGKPLVPNKDGHYVILGHKHTALGLIRNAVFGVRVIKELISNPVVVTKKVRSNTPKKEVYSKYKPIPTNLYGSGYDFDLANR